MFFLKKDTEQNGEKRDSPSITRAGAVDILPAELHYKISREAVTSEYPISRFEMKEPIKYISVTDLLQSDLVKGNQNVQKILESTSDLISGVYEGGFKIWECTFDLINFLESNMEQYPFNENTRILDLGCGSGLLGLYSLRRGANVTFQDFNSEVINFLTIPNVILNYPDETVVKSQFISGSWDSLNVRMTEMPQFAESFQFDYILSSETVYNVESLPGLATLIKMCLKPTGTMFLAAKTHYFGVGGGTSEFQRVIGGSNLKYEVAQVLREGVQREIASVKFG